MANICSYWINLIKMTDPKNVVNKFHNDEMIAELTECKNPQIFGTDLSLKINNGLNFTFVGYHILKNREENKKYLKRWKCTRYLGSKRHNCNIIDTKFLFEKDDNKEDDNGFY